MALGILEYELFLHNILLP